MIPDRPATTSCLHLVPGALLLAYKKTARPVSGWSRFQMFRGRPHRSSPPCLPLAPVRIQFAGNLPVVRRLRVGAVHHMQALFHLRHQVLAHHRLRRQHVQRHMMKAFWRLEGVNAGTIYSTMACLFRRKPRYHRRLRNLESGFHCPVLFHGRRSLKLGVMTLLGCDCRSGRFRALRLTCRTVPDWMPTRS